jgi:hypothetical protein
MVTPDSKDYGTRARGNTPKKLAEHASGRRDAKTRRRSTVGKILSHMTTPLDALGR